MIGIAFAFLQGSKLAQNTLAFLFLGLVLWVAYAGVSRHFKRQGFEAALQAVEQQNKVAAKAAEKVRLTVDACYDRGGDWDATKADCDL